MGCWRGSCHHHSWSLADPKETKDREEGDSIPGLTASPPRTSHSTSHHGPRLVPHPEGKAKDQLDLPERTTFAQEQYRRRQSPFFPRQWFRPFIPPFHRTKLGRYHFTKKGEAILLQPLLGLSDFFFWFFFCGANSVRSNGEAVQPLPFPPREKTTFLCSVLILHPSFAPIPSNQYSSGSMHQCTKKGGEQTRRRITPRPHHI